MVRIAGVDRDVSEVELLLHQMPTEQAIQEAAAWLANTHTKIGQDFDLNMEMDGGKKITISVKEIK